MNDLVKYNENPRVLFIGGSGQLGSQLRSLKETNGNYNFPSSKVLDLTDTDSISNYLENKKPDIIINAGAYTNVDKAEEEKELCNKINNLSVQKNTQKFLEVNIR